MRALVATAAFEEIAGSELVALEVLEELSARGFRCELTAHHIAEPAASLARQAGVNLLKEPASVNPFDYDLAWFQTQIAPVMMVDPAAAQREQTLCLFAHLDLKWNLAGPGWLEQLLADRFMYCSREAADAFGARGLDPTRAWVFHNAAPACFQRPGGSPRRSLRRLLIVSNHAPSEVLEAGRILASRGVNVVHWGSGGDLGGKRIHPEILDDSDAVLTIGKTVPYALRARLPVYIYDHLGGPGWLTTTNFNSAAYVNFSGRCVRRKLAPEKLSREIEQGFDLGAQAAASRPKQQIAPYRLEDHVQLMVKRIQAAPQAVERQRVLSAMTTEAVHREMELAKAAAHYFGAWKRASAHAAKVEAKLAEAIQKAGS